MEEKLVLAEPLTKSPLKSKELLEIFVFAIEAEKGSCPADIIMLQKGLRVASEKFPPLGTFVDPKGEMRLSIEIKSSLDDKSLEGRAAEEWRRIHISNSAKGKISSRIEEILTPHEREALEEAARAANEVWGSTAISSQ